MTDPRFELTALPPLTILMSRDQTAQEHFVAWLKTSVYFSGFEVITSPLGEGIEAMANMLAASYTFRSEVKWDDKFPFENTTASETTPTWREMADRWIRFMENNFGSDALRRHMCEDSLDDVVQIGGRALVFGLSSIDARRLVEHFGVSKCCVLYLDPSVPNLSWGTSGLRVVHCGGKHRPADQFALALSELR